MTIVVMNNIKVPISFDHLERLLNMAADDRQNLVPRIVYVLELSGSLYWVDACAVKFAPSYAKYFYLDARIN